MHSIRRYFFVCFLLAAAWSPWARSADTDAPAADAEQRVAQLASPVYADRQQAEQALISLGMTARDALLAGLAHHDPHVQRSCRRLLVDVLHLDHQKRLEAFLADESGEGDHDLAGWPRFKSLVGNDKPARELFVAMQREEVGLLESAEAGAVDAVEMRLTDIREMLVSRDPRMRQTPPFTTVAALLFVCSDPDLKVDPAKVAQANFTSVVQQGEFGAALKDGDRKPLARTLLGEWIRQPSQMQLIYQNLRLAVSIDLQDAGLDLAFDVLKQWKNLPANYVASAVEATGRLGGADYAVVLDGMLSDDRMCTQRVLPNKQRREIQVRDVALGWLVHLTGQKFDDYGLKEVSKWFDTLKRSPTASFNYSYFVFATDEERDAALKKWAEWVKEHPLPEVPKPHGSGRIVTQDAIKPNVKGNVAPAAGGKQEDVQSTRLELAEWEIVRALKHAERLAAEGRPEEAAVLVGDILASDEDYFYQPERGVALFRPLKAGAESLLASLPDRGRAAYELHFGPMADDLLNGAIEAGDIDTIAEVDRGFFYTRAGAEAAYLLGSHHRAAGRYVRGAVFLDRLRTRSPRAAQFEPALSLQLAACWFRAGMTVEAQELLSELLARGPDALDIGGELHQVRDPVDAALAWLEDSLGAEIVESDQWRLFRGDISGNRTVETGSPYLKAPLWAPLCEDDFIKKSLQQVNKSLVENRQTELLTLCPLVVDNAVVTRTPTGLECRELDTGQLRWAAPAENGLIHLLRYAASDEQTGQKNHVADGLRERLWEDPSFGTLSSDGKTVYLLEDRGFRFGPRFRPLIVRPDGRRQLDAAAFEQANLMSAYDLRSGKLLWEVGGSSDQPRRPLAGGKILGPPLPLGDLLYAVVEFKDQTRLTALDAATGRVQLQWLLEAPDEEPATQNTASNLQMAEYEPGRGVSPIHAGGMILCVTANNHVVAVDLASRTVRWSFDPPGAEPVSKTNIVLIQRAKALKQAGGDAADQWSDSGPIAAQNRVLLTPLDGDQLHCLNLDDGTLVWSADREDGLYLAGVDQDKVIVVGRGSVRALNLTDGQPAWQSPTAFPVGASPSGRGYLTADRVLIPLDSAEVVAVDLQQGQIIGRSMSSDGTVPGNLAPAGDRVVSVGLDGVRQFETLDARQQRLTASEKPSQVDLAEILLYQGQISEAVELLHQVRAAKPSARASELLGEAMLQSLRGPLDQWERIADELADTMENPGLRVRFHEELAKAYRRKGRLDLAWENYRRLLDAGADADELLDVSPAQSVRRVRHVQGQLASLWEAADPDLRGEMDLYISERTWQIEKASELRYFDFHPAAQSARLALAKGLAEDKHWLQAELLLRRAGQSQQPEQRAAAASRLAGLLRDAGQPLEAARFYARLQGPLAGAVCADGKTGAQIVAALPSDDRVARILDRREAWPVGHVAKDTATREASQPNTVPTTIPLSISSDDPFAPYVSVDVNMSTRQLIGYDAQGVEQWTVDLAKLTMTSFSTHNFYINEGRSAGHLLVVWLGTQVVAIDQLDGGKILWSRETMRVDQNQIFGLPFVQARLQARMFGRVNQAAFAQPLVVTTGYVAFQQGRMLVAVDPLTGDTLWLRDDLPMGADLTGDHQVLLVTPQSEEETVVLNAIDGSTLGKRKSPPADQRLCTYGRRVVTWHAIEDAVELKLLDPWQETVVWEQKFAKGSQSCPISGGAVAVLEPGGQFVILSCESGTPVLESQVDAVEALDSMFVARNDRRYILIANGPPPKQEGPTTWNRTLPGFTNVEGRVYALNATDGSQIWSADVGNQWFKVNHPVEAPALTFFKRHQKPIKVGNNSWRSDKPSVLIKILDARSGDALHESTVENSYDQNYLLKVDPEKHQLEIDTRLETITLTFQEPDVNRPQPPAT